MSRNSHEFRYPKIEMETYDNFIPETATENCLRRIAQHDSAIRAWVAVDPSAAMKLASVVSDENRRRFGSLPLAGMPLGIKDIIDVSGFPTRAGSALTDSQVAQQDAPVVAKLREAGAVILGKTVTTEFAYLDPPPTRNPWDVLRTPGGSSSGSAAAVASGMCHAALGTQTGGSVLRPAAFCGVVGFKPTHGWCSVEGIVPLAPSLDHVGIFGRFVADVAIIYRVIAGANASPMFGPDLSPPSLGVVGECFDSDSSPEVKAVFSQAIRQLTSHQAKIVPVSLPPEFSQVHENHLRIMAREAARVHQERYEAHPEQMGPKIRELIERGRTVSDTEYAAAIRLRDNFQSALTEKTFQQARILAMPAAPTTAPPRETTGSPRFNVPWSFSGSPAISIPCGLSSDGLPVGLQLVADRNCELELLAAAAWCEKVLQFRDRPNLPS